MVWVPGGEKSLKTKICRQRIYFYFDKFWKKRII